MSTDNNFIIYQELHTFAKNIQDYKNKILMHGLKTKFKDLKILYVLEKNTLLINNAYKQNTATTIIITKPKIVSVVLFSMITLFCFFLQIIR